MVRTKKKKIPFLQKSKISINGRITPPTFPFIFAIKCWLGPQLAFCHTVLIWLSLFRFSKMSTVGTTIKHCNKKLRIKQHIIFLTHHSL
jgi:hypothetical protein